VTSTQPFNIILFFSLMLLVMNLHAKFDANPEWYQTCKPHEKLCLPVSLDNEVYGSTMALFSCHYISSQGRPFQKMKL